MERLGFKSGWIVGILTGLAVGAVVGHVVASKAALQRRPALALQPLQMGTLYADGGAPGWLAALSEFGQLYYWPDKGGGWAQRKSGLGPMNAERLSPVPPQRGSQSGWPGAPTV